MASEHRHYRALGWVLLSANISASTVECAGFKNHCGSRRFKEPSSPFIGAWWMLPAYFYEVLEFSHWDPSLVSPSLSTSRSSHPSLPKWPGILLNPVDFYHSSGSSGSSEFLQFACLLQLFLIPLLACVFPSASSSSDRWNRLPLSVSLLCSQSEMYTDDYVASRYLFFPSSSPVKHFCCLMYHFAGNGTQTVFTSPRLPYSQVNWIPSWYSESSKNWEE